MSDASVWLFLGTLVTAIVGLLGVWLQIRQTSVKVAVDKQSEQDRLRLEEIKDLRTRIDESDKKIQAMGERMDEISRDYRIEQRVNQRMHLSLMSVRQLLTDILSYREKHAGALPPGTPAIETILKDIGRILDENTYRARDEPP